MCSACFKLACAIPAVELSSISCIVRDAHYKREETLLLISHRNCLLGGAAQLDRWSYVSSKHSSLMKCLAMQLGNRLGVWLCEALFRDDIHSRCTSAACSVTQSDIVRH